MKLKDKVAIVTGSGQGIGKAIAYTFVSEGAAVVLASRMFPRLEEIAEDIKSKGGKAKAVEIDISDEEQVQRMVAQTLDEYGQIDILVNNAAGRFHANVVDMVLDKWNEVIAVNLTGTMLCTREVLKTLIPRRCGNIVNISSVAGVSGTPGGSTYTASKWGIIGFTESLAIEVGQYNIRANCISPAATKSEDWEKDQRNRAERLGISFEEMMEGVLRRYPLKKIIEPQEVAKAALFLASDDSSAITGHNLIVTCGFHMLHAGGMS